jgi:transketolase
MHTLKPLDTKTLDVAFSNSKIVVTVEEHSVIGGLGSAVSEYKAQFKNSPPQLTIGLPDVFGKTAEYRYLLEKYGLVGEKIAARIRAFYSAV